MGARANIVVKSDGEQVCLYSHWGGSELADDLKNALKKGKRWDDFQYLTRIIFCEMVKNNISEETGFGITQEVHDNEYPVIYVNADLQLVTIDGVETSFSDFIT